MSNDVSYALPVAGLLTIGDPNNNGVEAQIAALGLGQEHVSELVRMAVDPELNSAASDNLELVIRAFGLPSSGRAVLPWRHDITSSDRHQ